MLALNFKTLNSLDISLGITSMANREIKYKSMWPMQMQKAHGCV